MKKLRLLLFKECNRNCAGCCNKDWDLDSLPICDDFSGFDFIMLTGGEPMLYPNIIISTVNRIREQTSVPIILYTAMTEGLDDVMPYLNGVTLTLHAPADITRFIEFDRNAANLEGKMLRLNIFKEAGCVRETAWDWHIKNDMVWIENCPLPENEVFMRI